jgi:hypothetical protein
MNTGSTPAANSTPAPPKPPANIWRKAWRIIYWLSILAGAWTLVLMLRRVPAPQVTLSPQAAQSAQEKLGALAAHPEPSLSSREPQHIALTEEELNSYLAVHLRLERGAPGADASAGQVKSSVRDVKVTLDGDRARVFAVFNLAGKDVTLQLEGRLRVAGGYLRFEPTGGSLGELSLPQSALAAVITRLMDNPQNRESFRMPPAIRDIRVENSELVIERQ